MASTKESRAARDILDASNEIETSSASPSEAADGTNMDTNDNPAELEGKEDRVICTNTISESLTEVRSGNDHKKEDKHNENVEGGQVETIKSEQEGKKISEKMTPIPNANKNDRHDTNGKNEIETIHNVEGTVEKPASANKTGGKEGDFVTEQKEDKVKEIDSIVHEMEIDNAEDAAQKTDVEFTGEKLISAEKGEEKKGNAATGKKEDGGNKIDSNVGEMKIRDAEDAISKAVGEEEKEQFEAMKSDPETEKISSTTNEVDQPIDYFNEKNFVNDKNNDDGYDKDDNENTETTQNVEGTAEKLIFADKEGDIVTERKEDKIKEIKSKFDETEIDNAEDAAPKIDSECTCEKLVSADKGEGKENGGKKIDINDSEIEMDSVVAKAEDEVEKICSIACEVEEKPAECFNKNDVVNESENNDLRGTTNILEGTGEKLVSTDEPQEIVASSITGEKDENNRNSSEITLSKEEGKLIVDLNDENIINEENKNDQNNSDGDNEAETTQNVKRAAEKLISTNKTEGKEGDIVKEEDEDGVNKMEMDDAEVTATKTEDKVRGIASTPFTVMQKPKDFTDDDSKNNCVDDNKMDEELDAEKSAGEKFVFADEREQPKSDDFIKEKRGDEGDESHQEQDDDVEHDGESQGEYIPPPKFSIRQKVFVRDDRSGLMYESIIRRTMYAPYKVLDSDVEYSSDEEDRDYEEDGKCWHYFVHFQHWNVKWDLWAEEKDVFEFTDISKNLANKIKNEIKRFGWGKREVRSRMRRLEARMKAKEDLEKEKNIFENGKEKREDRQNKEVASDKSEKKKRRSKAAARRQQKLWEEDLELPRKQENADRIMLPFTLKKVLVDEWELIAQVHMLPDLPAPCTVKSTLDQYLETKLEIFAEKEDNETLKKEDKEMHRQRKEWTQVIEGITLYFDHALPHLLYRQEIPQNNNIECDPTLNDKRMCEIYGCEYLLRFFVQLPAFLEESNTPEEQARWLTSKIGDLVRYLQKNQARLFIQTYRNAREDELMKSEHDEFVAKEDSKVKEKERKKLKKEKIKDKKRGEKRKKRRSNTPSKSKKRKIQA